MRQRLSGDGWPAAHPARTAATRRGGGGRAGPGRLLRGRVAAAPGGYRSPTGPGLRVGRRRRSAPQCREGAAAAGRSPGTEKIGRLSRRHHRDSLMVSSLLAPPPFILS